MKPIRWILLGAALALLLLVGLRAGPAQAAPQMLAAPPTATPAGASAADAACSECHSRPYLSTALPSDQALNLTIDGAAFASSLHGQAALHCTSCHTDAQKMARYGLNTNVLNTYVADFHGTTVTLFAQKSPDQLPNKPLCIDCHGQHNIQPVNAASSPVIQQNLLTTCRQCHPDATTNFPAAWLSHYTPSPSHNSLVFSVDLFYKILIPLVVGGMLLFVLADIWHHLLRRRGAKDTPV